MKTFPIVALVFTIVIAEPIDHREETIADVQFHSQGRNGQYSYGYSNAQSSKEETRSPDGKTRGSYSYVDANGQLQSVSYVADAENGFKLTSNTFQTSHPRAESLRKSNGSKVATVEHSQASGNGIEKSSSKSTSSVVDETRSTSTMFAHKIDESRNNPLISHPSLIPIPMVYRYRHPIVNFIPIIYPVARLDTYGEGFVNRVDLEVNDQYHLQNDRGQYMYGYTNGQSAKREERGTDGVTRGAYSYIDSNGQLQSVSYSADAKNGFKVMATNLPLAHVVRPVIN